MKQTQNECMPVINHVCSLGGLCQTAMMQKRLQLRTCSYPFDWVFSNANTIKECLEDDFKTFLDKSQYRDLCHKRCGHAKYNPNMFNHRNPLRHASDYQYYERCVDRFRKMLQCSEHKLFIMMIPNMQPCDITEEVKSNLIEFNKVLGEHASNYTLLVIMHVKKQKERHHVFSYHDNIHFLEVHTLSSSGGIMFGKNPGDNDYLDDIITSSYVFDIDKTRVVENDGFLK